MKKKIIAFVLAASVGITVMQALRYDPVLADRVEEVTGEDAGEPDPEVETVEETVSSLTVSVDTELMRPYFEADEPRNDLKPVFIDKVTFEPVASVGVMDAVYYVPYERRENSTIPPQLNIAYSNAEPSLYDSGDSLTVTINGISANYFESGETHAYTVDLGYEVDYGDGYSGRASAIIWMSRADNGYTNITISFGNMFSLNPNPNPIPEPDPAPEGCVNMYRLYNPNSGEHFYTSNVGERNNLYSLGWNYEGVGWIAPVTSNTPVYRLYNQYGGEHHYTTSLNERNHLISLGWNDEGIGWYSDDAHTVPLYRQYNPNAFANNHNYTTSLSENNWLVSIGWQAEGIGWYGVGT